MLVDAPALTGARVDSHAFRNQFLAARDDDIAVFDNLGGDARLIAPCPRGEPQVYPHLATFARHATDEQQQRLWQRVGTSGLGVLWVHIRLDRTPKYYTFAPYRRFFEAEPI